MSANTLRAYNAIFILDSRNYDQDIETLVEKLRAVLKELGAENIDAHNLGRQDFARVKERQHTGDYFIEINCDGPAQLSAALQEHLRLDRTVKRIQVTSRR